MSRASRPGLRYLVLGAGMQGRACAFDLLRQEDTAELLLADASSSTLASAKSFLRSSRARFARADLTRPAGLRRLARDARRS